MNVEFDMDNIAKAVSLENENSKSVNPAQRLAAAREEMKDAFGAESQIFQDICAGILCCLNRACFSLRQFDQIYDVRLIHGELTQGRFSGDINNFMYGYVLAVSYIMAQSDNKADIDIVRKSASTLRTHFSSSARYLG